jgi:hypothetical protein
MSSAIAWVAGGTMLINNLTHFVLVDFENVPGIDLGILGGQPLCVTLFLGLKSKLKPALVEQITTLPFEVRLIKVRTTRKNLVDFVLTYHLGEMVSRYPRGHYYIVSGDKKDFDPVVAHLKDNHLHISLHPDIGSLPFLTQTKPVEPTNDIPPEKPAVVAKPAAGPKAVEAPKPATPPKPKLAATKAPSQPKPSAKGKAPVDKYAKLLEQIKSGKHRPKDRAKLRHHIYTLYGQKSSHEQVTAVIDRLIEGGVVTINEQDKVTYL